MPISLVRSLIVGEIGRLFDDDNMVVRTVGPKESSMRDSTLIRLRLRPSAYDLSPELTWIS